MPWTTITSKEIDLMPDERAALEAASGAADDAAGLLPRILSRTVNAARSSIIAGGNLLGQDGTIPDQVRQEVIDITRWQFLCSFPALKPFSTPERQKLHDEARKTLSAISRGEIKVEVPNDPLPTKSPSNAAALLRPGRNPDAGSFDLTGTT